MNFCLCGTSTCLCETSCICINRGCLCNECHDLREKDGKEFGLPSSYRELAQSASDVAPCKYELYSRLPVPAQENYGPGTSSEVANESIKESASSIPKIERGVQNLQQVSSNRTVIPTEQEIVPQDIGTNKSYQTELYSSEFLSREDSSRKAPNEQEKQVYKAVTLTEEQQALLSKDDSESSSDEIPVAKESFDYLSTRGKYSQPKNNRSDSEKICSDISSTSERVELSSSRSSSGISILELPENEWSSSLQTEPHFTGNNFIAISSIEFSSNQIDNLYLQRPESTTPTMISGEGTRYDASLGRSISPIQVITTNPTVLVSSSGELHLLPLHSSQSLRPQTPASNSIDVSQSANLGKALSDSAVRVLSPPINMQNSENLQIEYREKLSSTLESCTSNTPEKERSNPCLGKREENSVNISDEEFKSHE